VAFEREPQGYQERRKMGNNMNKDRFIKEHREKGLCIECNNPVSKKSKCRCDKCLERIRTNLKAKRRHAKKMGLCTECFTEKSIDNNVLCEKCYYKAVSRFHFKTVKYWTDLKRLYEEQKGICPYSGVKLSIGLNAELDHIKAKSNGGDNTLENCQWVYAPVNKMKWNLSEEDFKDLIFKIADNFNRKEDGAG
jgi:CRISPR/Cas system Type II protein with McrA/HNH and RuvC-like nuclease domain